MGAYFCCMSDWQQAEGAGINGEGSSDKGNDK